jgi:LuxR family maltose regulon positive regulatory protein
MSEGLLRTKLFIPPQRPHLTTRQVLLDKLDAACKAGAGFLLVSAPAGFGKTTLVSDWARRSALPTAWLTLDRDDNDPARFWRYVDAAFESLNSRIGASLRPALYSTQSPVFQQIIAGLVNDLLSFDQECILVLDDFHLIEDAGIHDTVNFLLDHLPPKLRLAIITRSDPPLNLARRRGRGEMVEVRAADLRFSLDETAAFLNHSMKLGLSTPEIAALSQRTEGWIAGLQLAALSLQDESDRHAFVQAFSGDDRHIADYLVEEVLQRQLVEVQRFLLQTSILERLSAGLCDAVTGRQDSRAMLNALERANLFLLPLDNARQWFRYHSLFSDLLRKRLQDSFSSAEIASYQRAAAAWYEAQGDIPAAVQHARQIPDQLYILELLEKNYLQFFLTGKLPQLFELAGLLPHDLRQKAPVLCAAVAWAGLASGYQSAVEPWLEAIEAHYGIAAGRALADASLEDARRMPLLEASIIRLQLPIALFHEKQRQNILAIRDQLNALPPEQVVLFNDVSSLKPVISFNIGLLAEQLGDLDEAAQAFSETVTLARQTHNSNLFYLAAGHLANVQFIQGQLHAAYQTHQQALEEASSFGAMFSAFTSLSYTGLGIILYEWNDLDAANGYFEQGLNQARLWNLWESLVPLALARARLKQRAGDPPAALSILEEGGAPPLAGMDILLKAQAALLRGGAAASAWLAAHGVEAVLPVNPNNESLCLITARLLACVGRKEEAINLLHQLIDFAQSGGRFYTQIQALAYLARLAEQPAALLEALRLAQPHAYLSTFLDEGEPLQHLLRYIARQPDIEERLKAYAATILAAFDASSNIPRPAGGLVEPLSEREIEILRHIAAGLTNPEIARRLVLSPNTLKAHTQNIYTKLEVHSRVQAVNQARQLGLIE